MNSEYKRLANLLLRIKKSKKNIDRRIEVINELIENGSSRVFINIHKKNLIGLMKRRDRVKWAIEEWEFNNIKSKEDLGKVLMICRSTGMIKYYFDLKKSKKL